MNAHRLTLLMLATLGQIGPARAQNCPGGMVSLGDSTGLVHQKCGDPTLWDQRVEEFNLRDRVGRWLRSQRTVDEWSYDFGSDRLIQILTFHDASLVKVRTGERGRGGIGPTSDRPGIISVGQSKTEVVLKWGQPTYFDTHQEQRIRIGPDGELAQKSVQIDRLTWDFGPNRFIRILTFEDGRLIAIRTGERGQPSSPREPDPRDDQPAD